ncbi:MAG: DUF3833 family protein [Phycisphaerales bacterium]|nr:DUF3833 family protein [Hyphomonadaceae bacterium]
MKPVILAAALLSLIAACATRPPAPRDIAAQPFVIEQALAGRTLARGEFRSITGARRGFDATLNGSWDGRVLTLVEDFAFDDGERDRKTWRLEQVAPGRFTGTREDVVGVANGFQDGQVFRLEYDVRLGERVVRFRDVLALTPEGGVLNNATVGWYGLRVGSVTLNIRREAVAELNSQASAAR